MSCIVSFNTSFLLFQNKSINSLGIEPLTFRCTKSSNKSNKHFNTNNNCLCLSKEKKVGRKLLVVRAFSNWFESTEDKNGKDIYIEKIPEFNSLADFTKLRKNQIGGEDLQTAVVSYRKQLPWSILQPGFQVDLVAAIHIADKEYFADLQQELANYDRVLYEMITDKDPKQSNRNPRTRWIPPKRLPGARYQKFNIIGFIQRSMASILGLYFQLECLDYRRDNWYHADLDYHTFKLMQRERGENMFKLAREMSAISSKEITKSIFEREDLDPWKSKLLWVARFFPMPLVGLFLIESVCGFSSSPNGRSPEMKALFHLDLATAMKLFLAKQITSEFSQGKTKWVKNSVIIGERNRVVMEELRAAMNDGCQKIAILFGSGHMPDMDERLRTEFGLLPTQISWKTAWSLKNQKTSGQKQLPPFLSGFVKTIGWQLNRYQTLALLIFSLILAVDLWLWEVVFSSIKDGLDENILMVVQFLAGSWGKF
ncbi:hypothetical protein SUGI_0592310 [Cryptomeria japonica]|uniref:uncharacterized protein LOC131030539 n=1 Tax=Cryptomeria japonica TaxID=3369 RepID=UPI0024149C6A|nr:uncharacterized protein LOC131030539 [Cryptomeria japonica]GLJ29963.1 hypothetical protein SUGI_0592310 [Cryptomeria japonica]